MAAYLSAHPDVFVSADKELHFFDDHFDRGVNWYRSQFEGVSTERAVGEASPTYYLHEEAVARMASVVPEARLIAMLRDPVEAAWSNYWMQRSLGHEWRPFARAVADELEGRQHRFVNYVGSGRYVRHLEMVSRHFPREQLLVILFDDLRSDVGETFARTCRFIGVDDTVVPSDVGRIVNPSTRLRSERLRRVMLQTKAFRRVPFGLAHAIDRWNRREEKNPPMDAASRELLAREYADDNAALAALIGRDLSGWS